ncbi:MAG TPA: L-threonylcarbamoyladenylate synthase [Pyrinomonadaceae bacterium]|nr:L-threonylcarbamoyladenylate synthase [Pyrinomonadaceae bacterium]
MSSILVKDDDETHAHAARLVSSGGVLAFRTDTFYGLGADPFNKGALGRINHLKGRDGGKPILVVISDEQEAERFITEESEIFQTIARRHWPGALTIVSKARADVPSELTAGSGTVGLRLPDDETVRSFIRDCGGALTATSANLAGEPPARTAAEVARSFPKGLDLIVDGGEARGDRPSTVLDATGPLLRLIREGAVTRALLEESLKDSGARLL